MNAEQIAREAHEGQVEKYSGRPYAEHLERVVALVEGEDAKAVAWLHDVIEDSPRHGVPSLLEAGVHQHVVTAVAILTRGMESYSAYISRVMYSHNPLAIAVKIADLRDHLREETLDRLPESLRTRYEQALKRLI